MNLAEVQMLTGGPLEELAQALKDLTASNQKSLAAENDDFAKDTTRHELEVKRLEVLIQKEAETEAVIAACGEALELLRSLLNGQTSLAQVRVAQKAMKKIQD